MQPSPHALPAAQTVAHPSHAHPGGWRHSLLREMQELPQALPFRQTLQQAAGSESFEGCSSVGSWELDASNAAASTGEVVTVSEAAQAEKPTVVSATSKQIRTSAFGFMRLFPT